MKLKRKAILTISVIIGWFKLLIYIIINILHQPINVPIAGARAFTHITHNDNWP
jgi:hypothetical protein